MSQSNDRAPWTREALARTMPDPRDCDLGYESVGLNVNVHHENGEPAEIVLFSGESSDAWIQADPSSSSTEVDGAIDMEWFASFEDTRTRREYE